MHTSAVSSIRYCSVIPGENKYVYHLSDDTRHDATFVHEVLVDIFEKWGIKDETVIIKSDNAPTQYKNKYAFASMQNLANKYNVTIVRIFGAAGHGKGLIDAMSSFGVKAILRRDIVTKDDWFSNTQEIIEHLQFRGKSNMYYKSILPDVLDKARQCKDEKKIDGCLNLHLFVYKPFETEVYRKEYLCDCLNCIVLKFEECMEVVNGEDTEAVEETIEDMDVDLEECGLDEQLKSDNVFEFIEPDTYISMASDDYREPLYFAKVIEKNVAKDEIHDRFGHTIFPEERYIKAKYLRSIRSKKQNYKQYSIMENYVFIKPDEVFEPFVEINQDLSIKNDVYIELVRKSQDY